MQGRFMRNRYRETVYAGAWIPFTPIKTQDDLKAAVARCPERLHYDVPSFELKWILGLK